MNAVVYREPYQLPAGVLALAVHGAFFALLYFGFSWQTKPPATMSVELWQSLPDDVTEARPQPKPKLTPPPKVAEIVKPEAPKVEVKPDIALPDKKKVEAKPIAPKPAEPKIVEQKIAEQMQDNSAADQAAREQAERVAATGRVVDEYTAKIQGKIRRNIVMPPDVADDARAEFSVTLLPGGSILKAELKKSSGNAAYDSAVERAILKSQPLPLPPDAALFNRFRDLRLGFRPKE
jgi:colicin import membrane protein